MLVRGNEVTLEGDYGQIQEAKRLVEELIQMVRNGQEVGEPGGQKATVIVVVGGHGAGLSDCDKAAQR